MDPGNLTWLATPPRELPFAAAIGVLACAFAFGSLWGSFLNVVIARVPKGLSVVTPRSHCPKCKTQIAAYDNVPILSWLVLRAKCRTCSVAISPRYPLIELLGGLACTAAVARFGLTLSALELTVFTLILIAISFIDLDTFSVPLSLVVGLGGSGLGFGFIRWLLNTTGATANAAGVDNSSATADFFIDRLIGCVGAGLMLSAIVVVATFILRRVKGADGKPRVPAGETAMGWGDPMIIAGIGAYLGWQSMPLALFLASVVGSVVGLALKFSGRLKNRGPISEEDQWIPPDDAVPFGPFLALGGLLAAFFGNGIHDRLLPMLGLMPGGLAF